jgi:uracil-DNA glycosylase
MPEQLIDIKDIQSRLYIKLNDSGWNIRMRSYLLSAEFREVIETLVKEQLEENKPFTPKLNQIFRAFQECPYDKLNTVVIGQDPYPKVNAADGIAFSCSNIGKEEASLRYIFKAIEDTVYPGEGHSWDPDLKRWSNQGVLLLNTALTTEVGKIGQHYLTWNFFTNTLLEMLNKNNPGLIYLFLGKKAEKWAELIDDNNYKIFASHPASAAYSRKNNWNCNDCFNKINEILYKNNGIKINW